MTPGPSYLVLELQGVPLEGSDVKGGLLDVRLCVHGIVVLWSTQPWAGRETGTTEKGRREERGRKTKGKTGDKEKECENVLSQSKSRTEDGTATCVRRRAVVDIPSWFHPLDVGQRMDSIGKELTSR